MDDLEEDLQGLLDQMDEVDEFLPEDVAEAEEAVSLKPSETVLRPVDELLASDVRDISQETTPTSAESQAISTNTQKYLDRLDDTTEEILVACRSDRQEAQEVINICREAIEEAKNVGKPPSRMWVDGLVKAVEVKSGINTNAVKIIEANAKMLAATKAGIQINQQFNSGDSNLEDILSEPVGADEEY